MSRGRVLITRANPSLRSRRCPRLTASAPCSLPAGRRSSNSADTTNDTPFSQYARCGPDAATSAPPMIGATVQLTFSLVWMSEFARARSCSSTRFGRPAYTAGRKNPVASPAIPASATICPAVFANGRVKKTPARTRSETIMSPRRETRSSSGPSASPTATAGRNSTISRALTHEPEFVRSLMSTTSATVASSVPRLDPSVDRNSSRKPGAVPRRLS